MRLLHNISFFNASFWEQFIKILSHSVYGMNQLAVFGLKDLDQTEIVSVKERTVYKNVPF